MKYPSIIVLCLGLVLWNACGEPTSADEVKAPVTAEEVFDETAAQKAIMMVIEQETKCFFERDYECWKEHWIHEAYALQAWNNSDGTYAAAVGWDDIHEQGKEYIETIPAGKTKVSHPIVKRENIQFKFYDDNVAYLLWKQYNSDRKNEYYSISQETRLMEKRDGAWKIVNVSAFWDTVNKVPFGEVEM